MEFVTHWFGVHAELVSRIGIDAAIGLSAWLVLACGQVSLGNAGFAVVSGYAALLCVARWHWSVPAASLAGIAVATALGYALGFLLARSGKAQFAIATFAFGEFATSSLHSPRSSRIPHTFTEAWCYIALAACLLLSWVLIQSREGRAFSAIAQDEYAASGVGIDPARHKRLGLTAGAIVAGVAGVMVAFGSPAMSRSDLGADRIIGGLASAFVGGTSAVVGPVIGATLLDTAANAVPMLSVHRTIFDASVLLVCAIILPGGIWSMIAGALHWRPNARIRVHRQ